MRKKIIKKIILAIIPIMVFCIGMNNVKAIEETLSDCGVEKSGYPSCVDDHSCLLMCAYDVKLNAGEVNALTTRYQYRSVYIYMNLKDKAIKIGRSTENSKLQCKFNEYDILDGSNINWGDSEAYKNLTEKGICPSVFDVSNVEGHYEGHLWWKEYVKDPILCFDQYSQKNDCPISVLAGGSYQVENTKKYDINDSIGNYFNNYKLEYNESNCQKLRKNNTNVEGLLTQDFIDNFLYGNDAPPFFNGNSTFRTGIKQVSDKYKGLATYCDQQTDDKLANGEITEEEAQEEKEQNQSGLDNVMEQLDQFQEKMFIDDKINIDDYDSCSALIGEDLQKQLNDWMTIIKILVPIILIAFGMLDFSKAVLAQDEQNMKKAQSAFIKRLIIAVAIFFVPTVINLLINIANSVWPSLIGDTCGL